MAMVLFFGEACFMITNEKWMKNLEVSIQHGRCLKVKNIYIQAKEHAHKFHGYICCYIGVFVKQRTQQ